MPVIMYQINGSTGGGSILRIAIPIALAKQEDITITNIRQKRSRPGLRPQHLEGIKLICDLTNSKLEGGEVGSKKITITAGSQRNSSGTIEIGTAGSISLIYQMLSNYAIISQSSIKIKFHGGGTHTRWSPNLDYIKQVTIPALKLFGQDGDIQINRYGYYPKGGATGSISITHNQKPGSIKLDVVEGSAPLQLVSRASNHLNKAKVAERQIQGVLNEGIVIEDHQVEYNESNSPGSAITAWMTTDRIYRGFSQLGEKGKPAEKVGQDLANQILSFQEPAAVDEHLADQLILALSQSQDQSFYTIPHVTKHVTTNVNLINQMLDNVVNFQHHQDYVLVSRV